MLSSLGRKARPFAALPSEGLASAIDSPETTSHLRYFLWAVSNMDLCGAWCHCRLSRSTKGPTRLLAHLVWPCRDAGPSCPAPLLPRRSAPQASRVKGSARPQTKRREAKKAVASKRRRRSSVFAVCLGPRIEPESQAELAATLTSGSASTCERWAWRRHAAVPRPRCAAVAAIAQAGWLERVGCPTDRALPPATEPRPLGKPRDKSQCHFACKSTRLAWPQCDPTSTRMLGFSSSCTRSSGFQPSAGQYCVFWLFRKTQMSYR